MTHFFCVGYAGSYSFQHVCTPHLIWQSMNEHLSSAIRESSPPAKIVLEQDLLPTLQLRASERPSLRVVLCGLIWDGDCCYGTSLEGLLRLQALLDAQGPDCLDHFDGDFSLAYIPPDGSLVWLCRSIANTRGLYYRLATEKGLTWSTNPGDFFPQGKPTLNEVDHTMVAIVAATGIADPRRTCYKDIQCVPPGQKICFQNGSITRTMRCDYILHEDNSHLPYEKACKRLREHMEGAVYRALYGFPSLNVFLSGGLDTAVVAYEAARLGKDLHSFHWTWNLPMFGDERARAHGLADLLGSTFHQLDFSASLAEGGEYLRSTQGLVLPYNHAFYYCFSRTIAEVSMIGAHEVQVLAGGHLGDTLFQGDWADAFRLTRRSPKRLLSLLRDLLAWYPRKQAFTIFFYHLLGALGDLEENPSRQRIASNQPLLTPWAFEQVLTHGNADYRDLQSAVWKHRSASTRLVLASLQSNLAFNEALETAITYQDALAQQVVLRHPFSDKRLHEFCLSLGPHHRKRWCAGQNYDKFLLRLAYLGDLPQNIINREIRTPYAAISEQFCLQNREMLRKVFDQNALLHQFGILDLHAVQEILAESELCQRQSRSLFRIAGVEMWLRGLAQRPSIVSAQTSSVSISWRETEGQAHTGVVALSPLVIARPINGNCVLLHTQTLQVSRFDDAGMLYWEALTQERSWHDVIARLHTHQPAASLEEIEDVVYTFARDLAKAGWIVLREIEGEKSDEV